MVYQDNRECIVEVFNDVFSQTKLNGAWITFMIKLEGLFANWQQLKTVADKSNQIRWVSIWLFCFVYFTLIIYQIILDTNQSFLPIPWTF